MGVNRRNDSLPKSDRPTEREGERDFYWEMKGTQRRANEALGREEEARRKKKAAFPLENGAFGRFALCPRGLLFSRRERGKGFWSPLPKTTYEEDFFFNLRLGSVHKDGDFSSRRGATDRVTY